MATSVDGCMPPVIQGSKPEPRTMRYELNDYEWSDLYRSRNLVERFFNKIKQCRRIATRYDKLAANYLASIKLASIRLWIRAYESTP
jgi:transposase